MADIFGGTLQLMRDNPTPQENMDRAAQLNAHLSSIAANAFMNAQERAVKEKTELQTRAGFVELGKYLSGVTDWSDPKAEAGAWDIVSKNPWVAKSPMFPQVMENFRASRMAKDAQASRETIANKRNAQLALLEDLKSADRSFDNQAKMERLRERIYLGEDVSDYLLERKAQLGLGASIPKEIKIQNDIEQSRQMASQLEAEGDMEGAQKLRDRAEALDKTRQGTSTATIKEFNFLENLKKTNPAAAEAFTVLQKQKHPDRDVLTPTQQTSLFKALEEQVSVANGGALKDGTVPGPLVRAVAAENAANIQKALGIKVEYSVTPEAKTGGILPNAPGGPYFQSTVPATTNVTVRPAGAPQPAPTVAPPPGANIPGSEVTPVSTPPAPEPTPVPQASGSAPYSQELINASVALTEDKLPLPTVAERYKKVTGNDLPSFVEMTNPKGQRVKVPVAKLVEAVTNLGYKP